MLLFEIVNDCVSQGIPPTTEAERGGPYSTSLVNGFTTTRMRCRRPASRSPG
jgi:hypothetical protein